MINLPYRSCEEAYDAFKLELTKKGFDVLEYKENPHGIQFYVSFNLKRSLVRIYRNNKNEINLERAIDIVSTICEGLR